MSDITDRLRAWKDERGYPTAGEMLDEAAAEIARLVAEVERHRMTEDERKAAKCCAVRLDSVSDRGVIGRYLDRTAQKEVGRE